MPKIQIVLSYDELAELRDAAALAEVPLREMAATMVRHELAAGTVGRAWAKERQEWAATVVGRALAERQRDAETKVAADAHPAS